MIDYDKFNFTAYVSTPAGGFQMDSFIPASTKFMVIAEIGVKPQVTIRYSGFGNTIDEAIANCKETIKDYLLP